MKKFVVGILIGITVCITCAIIYVKNFMFVPDKDGMTNENTIQNKQINYNRDVEFGGYKAYEWEEMIKKFYLNNYEYRPEKVSCYYNELNYFIADLYVENDLKYTYVFDPNTLIATGEGVLTVDFINQKFIEIKTNFVDEQCLAIGYVLDSDIDEFIYNNFYNNYTYNNLEVLDYRTADSREKKIGNRFVIIPKSEDVKITLYNCFINEQGELELDNTLVKDYTIPFIILDDYLAETTIPEMCIKFECRGFEDIIPIVFSGKDGKLDLTGHEMEVKDVSIY